MTILSFFFNPTLKTLWLFSKSSIILVPPLTSDYQRFVYGFRLKSGFVCSSVHINLYRNNGNFISIILKIDQQKDLTTFKYLSQHLKKLKVITNLLLHISPIRLLVRGTSIVHASFIKPNFSELS